MYFLVVRPHRALTLSLLLALAAPGCRDPWARHRATAVDREQVYRSGQADLDALFLRVNGLQRELALADLRRFEAMRVFRAALEQPQSADRASLVAALQARLGEARVTRVEVTLEVGAGTEPALQRWEERFVEPTASSRRESFAAVERSVVVDLRPQGGDPAPLAALFAAISTLLRTEKALSITMARAQSLAAALDAAFAAVERTAPAAARPEVAAARSFAQGAGPRAQAQVAESNATLAWMQGLLAPEE